MSFNVVPSTPLQFRQPRTVLPKLRPVLCKVLLCDLVQWSTSTCSAVQSCYVSFGDVQCTSMQISLVRCNELAVLYSDLQFNPGWSSVAKFGEVKLRLRQSSPVQSSQVLSSPAHSTNVESGPIHSVESSPVQPRPIPFSPFQLSAFQSGIAQVHISQLQSSLVQSNAVQSSTIRNSPVPTSLAQCSPAQSS